MAFVIDTYFLLIEMTNFFHKKIKKVLKIKISTSKPTTNFIKDNLIPWLFLRLTSIPTYLYSFHPSIPA
jgi:hypothetical protein